MASDSFAILLHFLTYSLGLKSAKLQAHHVASVAEWLECLQYDAWGMVSNPICADFYTSILGQCSQYLTIYVHYMHDISVQKY